MSTILTSASGDGDLKELNNQGFSENWQCVNDTSPGGDGDSSYVYNDNNSTQEDLYTIYDYPISDTGTIDKLTLYFRTRVADNNGDGSSQPSIKTGGTVYYGDIVPQTIESYIAHSYDWPLNPDTGLAWTWTEARAIQIGIKLSSGTDLKEEMRCTQIALEVTYSLPPDGIYIKGEPVKFSPVFNATLKENLKRELILPQLPGESWTTLSDDPLELKADLGELPTLTPDMFALGNGHAVFQRVRIFEDTVFEFDARARTQRIDYDGGNKPYGVALMIVASPATGGDDNIIRIGDYETDFSQHLMTLYVAQSPIWDISFILYETRLIDFSGELYPWAAAQPWTPPPEEATDINTAIVKNFSFTPGIHEAYGSFSTPGDVGPGVNVSTSDESVSSGYPPIVVSGAIALIDYAESYSAGNDPSALVFMQMLQSDAITGLPAVGYSWVIPPDEQRHVKEIYLCILTGAEDSLDDLIIPMSSFTARMREIDPSYVNVIIPNILAYESQINERYNGRVIIQKGFENVLGKRYMEPIITSNFESLSVNVGESSASGTLVGYVPSIADQAGGVFSYIGPTPVDPENVVGGYSPVDTENLARVIYPLSGVSLRSNTADGKLRFRSTIDLFLKPGNIATYGPYSFIVDQVNYFVNPKTSYMETVE